MKITAAATTDKGKTRKNNEDSFLADDAIGLYAVADGIGGHQGGEVASSMAVETLREILTQYRSYKEKTPPYGASPGQSPAASALAYAFTLANTRVREAASEKQALSGMGTTLTAVLLSGKSAYLAHVGDSRAYLLRAGSLQQVTDDHGLVAEQLRAGLVTPAQARRSPYRHVITRAVGIDPEILVDRKQIEIVQNDVFLLCSDGLTEMVEDDEIMNVIANFPPKAAAQKLVTVANDHGGVDNITVVVIKIEELR